VWVCANCETENAPELNACHVCDAPRSEVKARMTPSATHPVAASTAAPRPTGPRRFAAVLLFGCIAVVSLLIGNSRNKVETSRPSAVQEEATFRSAGPSVSALRGYVSTCRICAFKSEALTQIARLEQEELARSEEQTYKAASGSADRLQAYLEACKVCAFRPSATLEMQRLNHEQSQGREAANYRMARGNIDRLKDYIGSCVVCAFKSDANTEIASIERGRLARQEEAEYQAARADLQRLKAYVRDCRVCDFAAAARSEIGRLEEPKAEFEIVNNTSNTINVAFYDGSNRAQIDPADGRAYIQRGQRRQSYAVSCTPGQNVCYGAAVQGNALSPYWGLGLHGKQNCIGCCVVCQAVSVTMALNASEAKRPQPTITWQIIDNTRAQLSIAFYSQNRAQTAWPGWGHNWSLTQRESTFGLNCQAGEKICYGAWITNNIDGPYWGVGPYSRHGCTKCCAVCDGGTYPMSLTD
jgi:hypothetical protein